MTVANNFYDIARRVMWESAQLDWEAVGTDFQVSLHTDTYTPAQNTDDFFNDATNEVTGTNYTAGGNDVDNVTVVLNGAGLVTVDGDDPATWLQNASGFNDARLAVLYSNTGVATTSPLQTFTNDFAANRGNVDGDFTIQFDAAGIFTSAR